jgi:hypothetical protein
MKPDIFDQKVRNKLSEMEDLPIDQGEVDKIMSVIPPQNRSSLPLWATGLIALFALVFFGRLMLQTESTSSANTVENKSLSATNQTNDSQMAYIKPINTEALQSKETNEDHHVNKDIVENNFTSFNKIGIHHKSSGHHQSSQSTTSKLVLPQQMDVNLAQTNGASPSNFEPLSPENIESINQHAKSSIAIDSQEAIKYSDFLTEQLDFIKWMPLTSVQNNDNLLLSIPNIQITPSFHKFRTGLKLEAGHFNKNIGIVGEYFFKPRWSIMTGVGLGISNPFRYFDHQDYEDETGEELNEHYPNLHDPDRNASDIKVLKKEIKIPLLLQFYRPLFRNFLLFASVGTSIKWLDNHNVTYTQTINGTDQKQNFQTNFYTFSMDVNGGVGVEKKFGRFAAQLSGVVKFQSENRSYSQHDNHNFNLRASMLYNLK